MGRIGSGAFEVPASLESEGAMVVEVDEGTRLCGGGDISAALDWVVAAGSGDVDVDSSAEIVAGTVDISVASMLPGESAMTVVVQVDDEEFAPRVL